MKKLKRLLAMALTVIISIQIYSNINVDVRAKSSKLTATQILEDINVGWNLGNSLDSCVANGRSVQTDNTAYFETAWGNPIVTKELIDLVHTAGFKAIRIPVTWYYNTYANESSDCNIRNAWMERVAQVVDYALANDMYVILDSHHDNPIIWAQLEDVGIVAKNTTDLWLQIAVRFRDYDSRLMFEGFNEINNKQNNWKYSNESAVACNYLNQVFVNTVRSTGGNNATRVLICGTYICENSKTVLDSFILPVDSVDDRLIVDVHSYNVEYDQSVEELFVRLEEFSKRIKAPVIIGEFGSVNTYSPNDFRDIHAGNFVSRAAAHGIKCFWWDDGGKYKLFDRITTSITQPAIIGLLMNPKPYQSVNTAKDRFTDISDYEYQTIDEKNGALVKAYKGALTLNVNKKGYKVEPGSSYRIKLETKSPGDGMCMNAIAFYDKNGKFISFTKPSQYQLYDIKAPENAQYMRVSFYNPWGYRTLQDFRNYFAAGNVYLEISKY